MKTTQSEMLRSMASSFKRAMNTPIQSGDKLDYSFSFNPLDMADLLARLAKQLEDSPRQTIHTPDQDPDYIWIAGLYDPNKKTTPQFGRDADKMGKIFVGYYSDDDIDLSPTGSCWTARGKWIAKLIRVNGVPYAHVLEYNKIVGPLVGFIKPNGEH